ncbi:MAG: hypothetical protein AAFZ15_34470 [Bacteroidota bacterium]
MNTLKTFFFFILASFATTLFAQPDNATKALNFKIQKINHNTYGVFVQPEGITPSERTITGSGQVTIVAPAGFTYTNLENHGGSWVENARVVAPVEATDKAYISFGFVTDFPKLNLYPNEETMLFSFTTDASYDGTFNLIDNNNDPFMVPNSYGTNPGNDLGIIDAGAQGGLQYYAYAGNVEGNDVQAVFTSKKNKKNKKRNSELTVAQPE